MPALRGEDRLIDYDVARGWWFCSVCAASWRRTAKGQAGAPARFCVGSSLRKALVLRSRPIGALIAFLRLLAMPCEPCRTAFHAPA